MYTINKSINFEMDDAKLNTQYHNDEDEFHDAIDEFSFCDCDETFSDPSPEDKTVPPESVRRRRSLSHRNSSGGVDASEMSELSSTVSFQNSLKSRDRKVRLSNQINECEKKLENEEIVNVDNSEKNDERSITTDANYNRGELNFRENNEADSSFLFTLASLMSKTVGFPFHLLVKYVVSPIRFIYNVCMIVLDPFGFLRRYIIKKVFEKVWPIVSEWLKEHRVIWRLGLKCGWGLLWSCYVCALLVGLLVSAFVMGGFLIKGVVQEPVRMEKSLNFDYTEKSPVAFVPLIAHSEPSHDIYPGESLEIGKSFGSRVIPPRHKMQVTVVLTLPESDYNQNLGIFQVRVDFLSTDGKTLASSRRPCMLHYRSLPIRLLLTFFKVAPILTGYTSETQNLKIKLRGFTEREMPTSSLRVVIEQRAEFLPGAGIPEIYGASLTLESELPLLKRFVWFWKKTLFIWISMCIFMMELVFALVCCKPLVFPKIRLSNDRSGQR